MFECNSSDKSSEVRREKEYKTSASDGVKRSSDDSSLIQRNLLDRQQISLCLFSCRAVRSNLSQIRNRSDRDQLLSTTHSTAHKKKMAKSRWTGPEVAVVVTFSFLQMIVEYIFDVKLHFHTCLALSNIFERLWNDRTAAQPLLLLFTWNLTWRLQYKPESGLLFVAKKRTWSQKKSIGSWISCESLQYLIYHFTAKLQISISQMINHLVHLMSCFVSLDDWKQSGKWTFSCMKLLGKRRKKKDILFLFDFKSESY